MQNEDASVSEAIVCSIRTIAALARQLDAADQAIELLGLVIRSGGSQDPNVVKATLKMLESYQDTADATKAVLEALADII